MLSNQVTSVIVAGSWVALALPAPSLGGGGGVEALCAGWLQLDRRGAQAPAPATPG